MIYYEYRSGVRRNGKVDLRPESALKGMQGYRSLYGYSEVLKNHIMDQNGTYGLSEHPLFADKLFIDIDNNKEAEKSTLEKLKSMGLAFAYYFSGKKGGHFHIATIPEERVGIYQIHKAYVAEHFPGSDPKIYLPSGIIKITGSYHKSNPGSRKELIYKQGGKLLDLTEYRPSVKYNIPTYKDTSEREKGEIEEILGIMMFDQVSQGGRNKQLCKLTYMCKDLGLTTDETLDKLRAWNNTACFPPIQEKAFFKTIRHIIER